MVHLLPHLGLWNKVFTRKVGLFTTIQAAVKGRMGSGAKGSTSRKSSS